MARIIDISMPVTADMPIWPGHPKPVIDRMESIAAGSVSNVTRASFCLHIGTHVDAPLHFLEGGAAVEAIDLHDLVGRAFVADLTHVGPAIRERDLAGLEQVGEASIVLLKTTNSRRLPRARAFEPAYVHIAPDAAAHLVERRVRTVGIDSLSVEDFASSTFETHRTLLGAGLVIVEGLDLHGVEQGFYDFLCLPVNVVGADGAPARAILVAEDVPEEAQQDTGAPANVSS
jgi:arylformamidase